MRGTSKVLPLLLSLSLLAVMTACSNTPLEPVAQDASAASSTSGDTSGGDMFTTGGSGGGDTSSSGASQTNGTQAQSSGTQSTGTQTNGTQAQSSGTQGTGTQTNGTPPQTTGNTAPPPRETDLFFSWTDGTIWTGISDGHGFQFNNWFSLSGWGAVFAGNSAARTFRGDFNGDGKADFLFTWIDGTIWVGLSDGRKFNFSAFYQNSGWGPVFADNSPARFFIGDFNGDGKDDVAFTWSDGNIWVGLSDGAHFTFAPWSENPAWGPMFAVGSAARFHMGDFNGDGKQDLLFTWNDGNIWVGISTGTGFVFSCFAATGALGWGGVLDRGSLASTFVGDFNGDRKTDFLFTWVDGSIWIGYSTGSQLTFVNAFRQPGWANVLNANGSARKFIGDINGDGKADFLFTWPDGNIWVGLSDGTHLNFSPFASIPDWGPVWDPKSAARMMVGDFNGDGKTDLLFTWNDGNVWVGSSTGSQLSFSVWAAIPGWGPVFDASSLARVGVGDFADFN